MDLEIVRWAESPVGFYVDRQWMDGRWVLGPVPIKLASYHADLLRHLFTPDESGRLPYDVIAWCEPAKSGKSCLCGLVAQYMGLHGEQNSMVVLASNKRDQAQSVMYKSLADSLRYNPALGLEPNRYEVELPNGTVIKAIPSNSRGEAGARFSLSLFDELWAYQYTDAVRLWAEFKTDPTRQHSIKMAVGYAGYAGESDLWLELLEAGTKKGEPVAELSHITNGNEPACWRNGRSFVFWSHECRQPWQTAEWIESQRRSLRAAEFARMIKTEFAEGQGNFCDPADWQACVDPEHEPLAPTKDATLYIGLDLALAAGGDDCAAIAVYADEGRVKVAFHQLWRGKDRRQALKLGETVKPWLGMMAEAYTVAAILYDPWQAQHLAAELADVGIPMVEVPQTHASRGPRDTALHAMVMDRRLVLYDHPDLAGAAQFADARELGNGQIFLTKSGRGKIDLLVALSNCASEADQAQHMWLIW